jgi:hypothetical protein
MFDIRERDTEDINSPKEVNNRIVAKMPKNMSPQTLQQDLNTDPGFYSE